jgi:hypothetical protein
MCGELAGAARGASDALIWTGWLRAAARRLGQRRSGAGGAVWCIFDNTAEGWATHDALLLQQALEPAPRDRQVASGAPE